jgi:alpha-beta hydrolase superfamily lysophospholipase
MKPNPSIQFLRLLLVLSILGLFLLLPRDAWAQTCATATIWASPPVVHYRTVIRDSEEHRSEPNFTVFIELPDGSAGDIDPGSITLNGLRAFEEQSIIGDANENRIADLMIKSNRSVLITGDGLLTVTGGTTSGACFAGHTNVQLLCAPTSVERSDYFLEFTTSKMPDPLLDGRPARLDVRRVKPVFPSGCPNISPIRALVLVHGQTIAGTAAFDLQYRDYSLMESLAMRGIDTFTVNHLGFGSSQILHDNPLDDPCNASLPQCALVAGTCTAVPGVCDCQRGQLTARMDQQGSMSYLNPNPLGARCPHTINTRFQLVTDQEEQLDWIVNDVLKKTGLEKIYLLGSSLGGSTIGRYLGVDVSHQDKIAGAIFLASTFRGPATAPSPTWPLGLIDRADAMSAFNLVCPGQQDAGIPVALWTAIQAQDPLGASWGPGGLSRYPIVPRFGWNDTAASQIEVPALVMNGQYDNVVPVARSQELWNSLAAGNKTLEQLGCASHALLWETCSGDGCVDPHKTVQKRVGDWILTGK